MRTPKCWLLKQWQIWFLEPLPLELNPGKYLRELELFINNSSEIIEGEKDNKKVYKGQESRHRVFNLNQKIELRKQMYKTKIFILIADT